MTPFNLADYEPVEDRLRAFWEEHPYGRVITELLSHEGGEYIVFASVYVGNELRNDPPSATGLASEFSGTTGVNRTSALENCETSAIGRALANLGYAPKGKRPSREEMASAAEPSRAAADAGSPDRGEGDGEPATSEQWSRLLAVTGGSKARAVNRINKFNRTSYTSATSIGATVVEVSNAITGGVE